VISVTPGTGIDSATWWSSPGCGLLARALPMERAGHAAARSRLVISMAAYFIN
jgi:hypothetical protein